MIKITLLFIKFVNKNKKVQKFRNLQKTNQLPSTSDANYYSPDMSIKTESDKKAKKK